MNTQHVNSKRWDDIVFESRNKEYGAYAIRWGYARNTLLGVVTTLVVVAFVLAIPRLSKYFNPAEEIDAAPLKSVKYTDLAPPPPIDKDTPPPPKVDVPPLKKVIKFLPPKVTDKEVEEEEKMLTADDVKQNDVGAEDIDGTGEVIFDHVVDEVVKEVEDEDKIFTVVEQQAEFEGGIQAMYSFISKNMKYPAQARRMGIEGSVFVSFVIDKEGMISDVQIVKGISTDCDKEAARVVKMMPAWKPGRQNGKAVKSRFVLPIKFKLA